jgi:hypothetical protein
MFKKKPQNKAATKADVQDDLAARRNDLQARLSAAEDHLQSLRADATVAARDTPDKLASLSSAAYHLEFEIAALTEALRQAEQAISIAEEAARQEADKILRQQTSKELHALADNLEKAVAPLPDNLEGLRVAIAAALPIIGENVFAVLLANLRAEIPVAVEFFAAEIRARADQTLAGTAPPTMPALPQLTIIKEDEPSPETTLFIPDVRVTWPVDSAGRRQSLGPYQIGGIPEFWARVAMERGLAILPDSDRYRQMRAEAARTGWPHVLDQMACRDLDRDPNAVTVHNFNTGRKLRDEPGPFVNYRENEPERQVGIEVMLPK